MSLVVLLTALRLFLPRLVPYFVFYPEPLRPQESDPTYWGFPEARELRIAAEDGVRLHAWLFPASGEQRCGAAIYFHGNAGHLGDRGALAAGLARLGLDVLLPDYRGYGLSEGKPSEEGLYLDALAAYGFAREEGEVPAERLLLVGNSLGASVAADLAARRQVAGVVLLGAFTSTPSVARRSIRWLPDWYLDWGTTRFDIVDKLGRIDAPVLVAAGAEDRVISPEEGRAVFAAAREPKTWVEVPEAGHNDLFAHESLWRALHAFTRQVLPCAGSAVP